jgi:hypothetical protein
MTDAQTRTLVEAITGAWKTRVVYEGVKSGLFEHLGPAPTSAKDLAAKLNLDAPTSVRILRALAALGLCEQVSTDSFIATETGARLRAGVPGSLRGMAMMWGDRVWKSIETIGDTLRTGIPGRGNGDFNALHSDPHQSDVFNRSMAEQSEPIAIELAKKCDFSHFKTVMDVGGGYGAVLIAVLRANPALKGFVYDLGLISAGAERYLQEAGVADRGRYLAGDFFKTVPEGADCIMLKYILHDWPDDDCTRILKNCRAALQKGAMLMVLERILPDRVGLADQYVVRADLVMMPISGKERTIEEFRTMLADTGFAMGEVKALAEGCSVIECRAV